jgi:multiple antibiotic resistance protein
VFHFWQLILGTVIGLLPIINPIAVAPVVLALTEGDPEQVRRQQVRRACMYMVIILVGFLIGGTFIMSFFGISIPGVRIAGGLLVVGIGMGMLTGRGERADGMRPRPPPERRDIAFSPLAMPTLSGPGSIAVTIGFTSLARGWLDYIAIILGIIVVALANYIVLRLSTKVVRVIGQNGMRALTRIMGFLIVCIGIQFIVNGVIEFATDPDLLRAIREGLNH